MRESFKRKMIEVCNEKIKIKNLNVDLSFYIFFTNKNDNLELFLKLTIMVTNKIRQNFKLLILFVLSITNFVSVCPLYAVEKEYQYFVERFKKDVKNRNSENMSTYILFPLDRKHPIPDIKSKEELKNRFDELFDNELTEVITNSDVETDWSSVGWRGIMLNRGIIWFDYDGRLIAINHQSNTEKSLKNNLIKKDKTALHESLRNYQKPISTWETTKFKIRLDDLGDYNYRYASWNKNKTFSDKPDLVLFNGILKYDGSGGNHSYTFKNGVYIYQLYINRIGSIPDTPEGELSVFKNDNEILNDRVIKSNE